MAGEFSNKGAEYALDIVTGRAAGPGVRTTYLALLAWPTGAPGDATDLSTMQEINTAGYSRQSVAWTAPSGDPRSTSNSATITFGPFTADPPNVTHCALVSAASGTTGDLLMFWTLNSARDAQSGDSIQVNSGALTMTLD